MKNCFGFYSYSATIFIFFVSLNLTFDFDLILGSFFTFRFPEITLSHPNYSYGCFVVGVVVVVEL